MTADNQKSPPEPFAGGMGGMELVWRCLRCGYQVDGPADPPQRCPVCGASREDFVLLIED